jgi:hypothetical protein
LVVEGAMQRAIETMSVLVALMLAAGCGSDSDSNLTAPSSPVVQATAPKADITVVIGSDAVTGPSLDPNFTSYVQFTASMSEAAGLGAHLNYVRGDFYKDDALVDRYDFSGAQLIEQTGSNRLEAGSARSFVVLLRWNAPCDLMRVTFQFTDDQGHDHHLVGNIGPTSIAVAASTDDDEAPRL